MRDIVDLTQSIGNHLLIIVVRALKRVVILGTVGDEASRHHTWCQCDEEEKKHGHELSENYADIFLLITTALLLSSILWLWLTSITLLWLMPKEHEVEEILGGDEITIVKASKVATLEVVPTTSSATWVRFSALEWIWVANLIILTTFLWIGKNCHGLIDFLEGVVCLRWGILIWMHLEALLLVCFFELRIGGVLIAP